MDTFQKVYKQGKLPSLVEPLISSRSIGNRMTLPPWNSC